MRYYYSRIIHKWMIQTSVHPLQMLFLGHLFACVRKTQQKVLMTHVKKHTGMNSCHGDNHASCSWSWKRIHFDEEWEEGVNKKNKKNFRSMTTSASMLTPTALWSYHGPPDVGQPALGFVLCKLQTADVLQTSLVLAHLLVDDQLHTPADQRAI